MAQVLLIATATVRPGICVVGDVVGVFDDDHVFSPAEKASFIIKKVSQKPASVKAELIKSDVENRKSKYVANMDTTKTVLADMFTGKA